MARLPALLVAALIAVAAYPALPAGASPGGWARSCTIHIVAVSGSGRGVLGNLTVTIRYPGSGRVYISTSPATEVDTQGSARLAAFAASLLAGVDMREYDFYYDVESPSIIVGGPSAGAAMALATLDLLTGTPCNPLVDVTGMIQPDASIGPVGGLKAKLEAAAEGGARLFVVPAGQEVYTYYETKYERIGPIVWVVREPVTVNLTEYGERLGVKVETAATLLQLYEIASNRTIITPAKRSPKALPQWFTGSLRAFVNETVERVKGVEEGVTHYSIVRGLLYNATSVSRLALREEGASPYKAAIDAVNAEAYALEASYIDRAITSSLDVTSVVGGVNESLIGAWGRVGAAEEEARGSIQYLLLARAYGMLGVAAFYYRSALESLRESGGHYYVPVSILGGADFSGLYLLARARALVDWALFWANASMRAPPGNPVTAQSLRSLSSLLLSEARTTVAYLDRLLSEAGAQRPLEAGLAESLADTALAVEDPVAVIGLSIESIAASTTAIHETFTLRPAETRDQMLAIASAIEPDGDASAVSSALETLAGSTSNTRLSLIAASKAVLYAWLEHSLATSPQHATPAPEAGTRTTAPASTHATTRRRVGGTTTAETPSPGRYQARASNTVEVAVASAASAATVALLCVALKARRPGA